MSVRTLSPIIVDFTGTELLVVDNEPGSGPNLGQESGEWIDTLGERGFAETVDKLVATKTGSRCACDGQGL